MEFLKNPLSLILVFAVLLPWPAPGKAEGEAAEYAIKATYLYKFAGYVDWPAGAFASPSSPLNLCVAGDDPFGPALDAAAGGQRIAGREVAVRRLKSIGRDSGCHILFVGEADSVRAAQALAAVHGSSVLTVADGREARSGGAMINFVVKDNRVRFEIDEQAAAEQGLGISSKLLALAANLRRPGPEGR